MLIEIGARGECWNCEGDEGRGVAEEERALEKWLKRQNPNMTIDFARVAA